MMKGFKPEGPAGDGYAEVAVLHTAAAGRYRCKSARNAGRRHPFASGVGQVLSQVLAPPALGASQFGSGGGCLPTAVGRISSALPTPRPLTFGDHGDRARE